MNLELHWTYFVTAKFHLWAVHELGDEVIYFLLSSRAFLGLSYNFMPLAEAEVDTPGGYN